MICIGGHFTMDGKGAGFAMSELMKPKKILPIHYGTFGLLKGTPEQLKESLGDSGIEVLDIQPGQAVTF
jgi:L-ascorbate metabolism protein UlaG (beta-lactamase superfamily)